MHTSMWIIILIAVALISFYLIHYVFNDQLDEVKSEKKHENIIVSKEITTNEAGEEEYYFTIYHLEGNERIEVSKQTFNKYNILDEYLE